MFNKAQHVGADFVSFMNMTLKYISQGMLLNLTSKSRCALSARQKASIYCLFFGETCFQGVGKTCDCNQRPLLDGFPIQFPMI